jgi:hypothetical protein
MYYAADKSRQSNRGRKREREGEGGKGMEIMRY